MKYIVLSFVLSFVLLSCNSNKETEISQQEFQRILKTDTIESITTSDASEFASIKIKGRRDNEYFLLRISSYKNFQDSLDILIDSLADNYNIHPIILSSSHVGLTNPTKDDNKLYDNKYWLMLLILPFILIVYYEVKGKRKKK
jgi:ATP-dependent Zn protease